MIHSNFHFKAVNGRLNISEDFISKNISGIRIHNKLIGFLLWLINKAEFIKAKDENGQVKVWSINKNSYVKYIDKILATTPKKFGFQRNNIDEILTSIQLEVQKENKNLLQENPNKILEFIKNNYNIRYKGVNVTDDMSNVTEFLLEDIHISAGYNQINSLFINTFSKKDDIVLVEAIPSMVPIEKDEALQSVWLETQSKIMGWDNIKDIMSVSLFQETGDLERQGSILVRTLLDPKYDGNKSLVKSELTDLVKKVISLIAPLQEKDAELMHAIKETFHERTQSMQETLIKAKEISQRTFLIAGSSHLTEKYMDDNDPAYSLSDFYDFLQNRNVIILCPKPEKIQEMGLEIEQIMQKAAKAAYNM